MRSKAAAKTAASTVHRAPSLRAANCCGSGTPATTTAPSNGRNGAKSLPGGERYKHVFAGSDGVIYVVKANGDLVWHRHADQRRGAATLSPPKKVGTGWGIYEHVFYAGNGYIYGVEALQLSSTTTTGPGTGVSGGRLIRWRHVGMSDGSFEWEGPIVMDTFWSGSEFVFADGTDRAVNGHSLAQPHRFCEFKDPPGSPTLGPRSYGISGQTNIPRRMPLTWSIDANASVSNIPVGSPPLASPSTPAPATLWSIINRAFAIWSTPNPLSPSTGLALSFQYVNSDGDIVFDAKDLGGATATGGLTLGETEPRGNVIHFNNNPAVVFAPQVPSGGPPLAPNVSSLLSVATHEIGHALGLLHNTNSASMMTPLTPTLKRSGPTTSSRCERSMAGRRNERSKESARIHRLSSARAGLGWSWRGRESIPTIHLDLPVDRRPHLDPPARRPRYRHHGWPGAGLGWRHAVVGPAGHRGRRRGVLGHEQ